MSYTDRVQPFVSERPLPISGLSGNKKAMMNEPLSLKLSPGAIDMAKLLALLAMIIDHANTIFLSPSRPELFAFGRMAFPLFALIWALNLHRQPSRLQARANRLWMWSFITQPVFWLAFREIHYGYALNILFVFAGVTQLFAWAYRYQQRGVAAGTVLLCLLVWPLNFASYGPQGIILTLSLAVLFSPELRRWRALGLAGAIVALLMLNGMYRVAQQPLDTLTYYILPTLVLPFAGLYLAARLRPEGSPRFLPRQFFYYAYAGHLLIYGVLLTILTKA